MLRIIDNKKIELTNSEFDLYEQICHSYDTAQFKGSDLFKDLFETDENGIIIFLRPPAKSYSSLEVIIFLTNIMIHQHLRCSAAKIDSLIDENIKVLAENKTLIERVKNIEEELIFKHKTSRVTQ
jgi:hypothetical protein